MNRSSYGSLRGHCEQGTGLEHTLLFQNRTRTSSCKRPCLGSPVSANGTSTHPDDSCDSLLPTLVSQVCAHPVAGASGMSRAAPLPIPLLQKPGWPPSSFPRTPRSTRFSPPQPSPTPYFAPFALLSQSCQNRLSGIKQETRAYLSCMKPLKASQRVWEPETDL